MKTDQIQRVGIVGTGVIGSGWAARFLAHGLDVVATDPAPGAAERMQAAIDNAWPALVKLGLMPGADRGRLRFTESIAETCAAAHFVQECAPEREDLKRDLLQQIDASTPAGIVIASSSSGLLPTHIQANCAHPERLVIGHPFNPVYLLPLVEVVGGKQTQPEYIQRAMDFYHGIGMHPLHVRNEIEGYISDRLQEALWREALHLVNDGIATTEEIDDAVIYGPGLRWAIMGTCLTFHLAGGEGGMRHMLEQFGPALQLPWTKLQAPELSEQLIDRMVAGTEQQAAGQSIRALELLRDDCLIGIMRTLRQHEFAAGNVIAELDRKRYTLRETSRLGPDDKVDSPLQLYNCAVDPNWIDYNGHMTEASYLTAFGDASDVLFRSVGIDEDYRAGGNSFYTVETHVNFYQEVGSGEPLHIATQLLGLDSKRLHIFHSMYHGISNELLATTEQMLLHVNTEAASVSPIQPEVFTALTAIMEIQQELPIPEQVGHQMSVPNNAGASSI